MIEPITRAELADTLRDHARRPIRAFLADRRIQGTELEDAFWDAVYFNTPHVEHAEARRVAKAMEASALPVRHVLEGGST